VSAYTGQNSKYEIKGIIITIERIAIEIIKGNFLLIKNLNANIIVATTAIKKWHIIAANNPVPHSLAGTGGSIIVVIM
jgi:hypothetical protein